MISRSNRNSRVSALAIAVFLTVAFASEMGTADGSHNTEITVTNKIGFKIKVRTYNGSDHSCQVQHKNYTLLANESKKVKCHGKGKGRCGITILKAKDNSAECGNLDNDLPGSRTCTGKANYIDDKKTLKVRHTNDTNPQDNCTVS